MVVGGDGAVAHKRRLKTKLISMAMLGFTRVIIEPSGIYDVDEFFDLLYEEPIDSWYEVGNVIAIVNPKFEKKLSEMSSYLFMSEIAQAGAVVLSRTQECNENEIQNAIDQMSSIMEKEANLFAAEILMEDAKVLMILGENRDFYFTASLLEVPPEFLEFKFRLMRQKGYTLPEAPIIAQSNFLKVVPFPEHHPIDPP